MVKVSKYIKYFSFFVIALFIILGLMLVFSNYFEYLPLNFRIIFAVLLVAYGSFRFVSIIFKPKDTDDENDN
jgi:uncharacterized membrane protein